MLHTISKMRRKDIKVLHKDKYTYLKKGLAKWKGKNILFHGDDV